MWRELQQKTRAAEPLRDFDKKIATAQEQIDDFYKNRLPAQDSAIYEELGKLAGQNEVKIEANPLQGKRHRSRGLCVRVEIEADFSGGYLQLVRFINALERDPLFFIIDSVATGRRTGRRGEAATEAGNLSKSERLKMQLGTESRNKTIAAVSLMVLALIFVATRFFSDSPAAAKSPTTEVTLSPRHAGISVAGAQVEGPA